MPLLAVPHVLMRSGERAHPIKCLKSIQTLKTIPRTLILKDPSLVVCFCNLSVGEVEKDKKYPGLIGQLA